MKRFKRVNDEVVIEVAVNHSRQLFNERDPAPFKERDLDENFVSYVVNSVQQFPLKAKARLRIILKEESDLGSHKDGISDAIRSNFLYQAELVRLKKKKSMRLGRFFLLIGLITLFTCLSLAQLFEPLENPSQLVLILKEGLVIIGWVAMWRPLEMFLYDWWPLREKYAYMNKIAHMQKEICC